MKRALKKHSLANEWGDWTMLREEIVLHAVDAMLSVTKRRRFGSSSRHFLRDSTALSQEMVSELYQSGVLKVRKAQQPSFQGSLDQDLSRNPCSKALAFCAPHS